ncbi:MAG TPA: hypothetical protein VHI93_04115 [Candidatus Thermoplasmatota archaeon]|nr:hypothetical protein [Candidatus Thermoplasmatota archaeon]
MERQTETVAGIVFLGLMVIFLLVAITTFQGTPTFLLIIGALICLGVGLFFFAGKGAGSDGPSQQQSVVLGDGHSVAQGSRPCVSCGSAVAATFAFCPHCGAGAAR